MRLVLKTARAVVYDDVLTREEFASCWAWVQQEEYAAPQAAGNWLKVWRLTDGAGVGGPQYNQSARPWYKPDLERAADRILEAAAAHPDLILPWADVAFRSYLYPRQTKLSWHDDSAVYTGAATFYTHPKWGSTWGGELMVAEVPGWDQVANRPPVGPHLDHEWEDQYIQLYGLGQWIAPKPNRLVLMAPGTYHQINRVDADAGDHCRCSIVGFFRARKKADAQS
jgi:hypothetical protein